MNQKVVRKPDEIFLNWLKQKNIPTKLLQDYNSYQPEGNGFVFESFEANILHQTYKRALDNPKIEAFEEEVSSLDFNFQRIKKPNQVLYTNKLTRLAYEIWQIVCGKQQMAMEGKL